MVKPLVQISHSVRVKCILDEEVIKYKINFQTNEEVNHSKEYWMFEIDEIMRDIKVWIEAEVFRFIY
jgi:hypothetical protein